MNTDGTFGFSQRRPPQNVQAEQALLGALLANNRAYERVSEFLVAEHFADAIHGRIYAAIQRRVEAGQVADAVTLCAEFEHSGVLDEVGGTAYLAQLLSAMVGIINAGEYGRTIRDAWHRRELIELAETLHEQAFAPGGKTAPQLQAEAESRMAGLLEGHGAARGCVSLDDAMDAALRAADEAARRDGPAGLATGFRSIDAAIGGLERGSLTVVAGRPGMGKSALCHHMALDAAKRRIGVVEISLEMTAAQLGRRTLSVEAGVPLWKLKRGQHQDCAEALILARKRLRGLPLSIEEGAGLGMAAIASKIRAAHRRHGVGLILVDHLHIVQPDVSDIRHGPTWTVGRISGAMKRLAKDFDCPVLLAAQLNRGVDGREDKRPALVDLRQSGDIEQDADAVMFVYRPEYYLKSQPERRREDSSELYEKRLGQWHDHKKATAGKAEIIIAKQRDGDTPTITLRWDGETTSFSEVAEHD